MCYDSGEGSNSCRSEGPLAPEPRDFGRSAIPTRPRPLSFLRAGTIIRLVQFMPANDCNLRPISSSDLDFRPPLVPSASSGSLACRKVQNTRRKRAIRDRAPLTFHFSWFENYSLPQLCTEGPRTFLFDNIVSQIEIVFRGVRYTDANRSLINNSRIRTTAIT